MRKIIWFVSGVMILLINSICPAQDEDIIQHYTVEFGGGIKAPLGITKNDIAAGLAFRFGMGYMLTRHFELAHLAIELGSSSPIDPDMVTFQDYYSYYGRVAMETVLIFGTPLTTRFHFKLNDYFDGFIGAGGAFYYFSTHLDDPYYGQLKKPRSRKGFGSMMEIGINSNLFSDTFLVGFKVDLSMLQTAGKTLSLQTMEDKNVSRMDQYLTFSIGMRYAFDR